MHTLARGRSASLSRVEALWFDFGRRLMPGDFSFLSPPTSIHAQAHCSSRSGAGVLCHWFWRQNTPGPAGLIGPICSPNEEGPRRRLLDRVPRPRSAVAPKAPPRPYCAILTHGLTGALVSRMLDLSGAVKFGLEMEDQEGTCVELAALISKQMTPCHRAAIKFSYSASLCSHSRRMSVVFLADATLLSAPSRLIDGEYLCPPPLASGKPTDF